MEVPVDGGRANLVEESPVLGEMLSESELEIPVSTTTPKI